MKNMANVRGREGFTLIEVLVTLILLAVLAAAVFPVVTQNAGSADPVKAAQDLGSIRSGIEGFSLNVRPSLPGDLEDLVYAVSSAAGDLDIDDVAYGNSATGKWDGPYVDLALAVDGHASGTALATGFGGLVENDLACYNGTANEEVNVPTNPCVKNRDFVAVELSGLSHAEWEAINDLIDGETETEGTDHDTGKFRFDDDGDDTLEEGEGVYYLAVPFR